MFSDMTKIKMESLPMNNLYLHAYLGQFLFIAALWRNGYSEIT